MSDLARMLVIAKSALFTHRYALDVTSNNMANAESTGYSRQKAIEESTLSYKTPYGYLSSGVEMKSVERVRDFLIDREIRSSNAKLGYVEIMNQFLDQIEAYFNEPIDNGISVELENFFKAFEELAANPEEPGVRQAVVQQGVSMSKVFNELATNLDSLRIEALRYVTLEVGEINDLIKEIAHLNQQIFALGANVNELEDIRDNRVDELSKHIDIKVLIDHNGLYNISAASSTIVSGITPIYLEIDSNTEHVFLFYEESRVALASIGGQIGAYMDIYNDLIFKYTNYLNTLTSTLINEVNALHREGYGMMNVETGIASTGIDYFLGKDANSIRVNDVVLYDITNLAVSKDGNIGDNLIAYEIAKIYDKKIFDEENTSIAQYYRKIIAALGYENSDMLRSVESYGARVKSLEALKYSVSGVSMDEEMINLVSFQRAFEAASKVVNTVEKMYDNLFNMVRG
jgi:flagellar hook-associated protein 1 FlgK